MSECKHKRKDGVCLQDLEYVYKGFCVDGPCSCFEPQTNYDLIISKTPEELASIFANFADCQYCGVKTARCSENETRCRSEWLSWLKSPVEVDE